MAAILSAAAVGCLWIWQSFSNSSATPGNVILISIDTCRADYLSCYGHQRITTPNLDKLAKHALLFENVISPVPITLPAHGSMLTGLIPPSHGARDNIGYQLSPSNLTLAEIMQSNGFSTGGVISSFVLDSDFGLDQGFDTYDDEFDYARDSTLGAERIGSETTEHAINWIEAHCGDKFFLFVHYYDPHVNYEPPEPFSTEYSDDLYAGEIAYTDHCIGKLLTYLKEQNLYDSSLIIVAGDHGEMLGEHNELTHTYYIYQSAIKVPLIIKPAGKVKAHRIKKPVGLIDIAPAVCGFVGVEPPGHMQGYDLSRYVQGGQPAPADRAYYCESIIAAVSFNANMLTGLVTDRFKYIHTTRPELYNLTDDPSESNNLIEKEPQRARILRDRLEVMLDEASRKKADENTKVLDERTIAKLQSLGYVGSNTRTDTAFDETKQDPKDLIRVYNNYQNFLSKVHYNQTEAATQIARDIIAEYPMLKEANLFLAIQAMGAGQYEKAVPYLNRLVEMKFDLFKVHFNLGVALSHLDEFDDAIENLNKALQINPKAFKVHNELGGVLRRWEQTDRAVEHYKKSLELDPEQAIILGTLAGMYSNSKDYVNAVMYWKKALALQPNWTTALNNLAWIHVSAVDTEFYNPTDAIILAQKASGLTGHNNALILDTLAAAYAADGNFSKAAEVAQKAVDAAGRQDKDLAEKIRIKLAEYRRKI